jgi:pimeloyl-ACP methyl ester carboxylesterase
MKRPSLLLLAALGVACASAPLHRAAHRLPLAPCTIAGYEGFLCGTYSVYEDREAASGRKIPLFVAVAPALTDHPKPDPIFYFEGGPGAGAAESAKYGISEFDAARQQRDLVFVDQRGTGSSYRLDCPFGGTPEDPQGYFDELLDDAKVESCRARLEPHADLRLYTTALGMDDVDEVRGWLGYDKINLIGGSYGTRAIQVFLRRHPEHARSAILLGVAGMDQYLPLYHARDAKRATDLLFAACAADAECHAAFPDVADEFRAILERLDREPATAQVTTPSGKTATVKIPRSVFAEIARFTTYTPKTAVALPLLVHQAYEGDFQPFAEIGLAWQQELDHLLAWGMWLSATCAEDLPFITPEAAARETAGTYLGDYRVRIQKRACEMWPRGEIDPGFHRPVTADVPTLLISGELDPVTPPSWAEEVAAHLPDSLQVVIPHGHHGFDGLAHQECLENLLDQFVDSASFKDLDTACVETMTRPPFLTSMEQLAALRGD